METGSIDWDRLKRLRKRFLQGEGPPGIYWESEADLAHYHRFFAERIGWKWDDALEQARASGWNPRCRKIFDWGCGTGIACIRALRAAGPKAIDEVILWDHSTLAAEYAKDRISEERPDVAIRLSRQPESEDLDDTLCLASHVLNELSGEEQAALARFLQKATQVFLVEAGDRKSSRLLMKQRESLNGFFRIAAPCIGNLACPMALDANASHWCHFFAKPPIAAFTESSWNHFSRILQIDLRSLPYSFLALDRDDAQASKTPPPFSRIIGRPRQRKGYAQLLSCSAAGLAELELQKRDHPALWKAIKKRKSGTLFEWSRIEGGRIKAGGPAR